MSGAMIEELTTAELAHVIQGVFESFLIEIYIKDDGMQVGRHDDVGIDRQVFVGDAIIETIRDDFAGSFVDENGQPFHDCEGQVIHADIADNAIAFHGMIIRLCGDLRSIHG